jgi:branched-chain amino acid transport system substrate-binding protein
MTLSVLARAACGATLALSLAVLPAAAQEPLKIGFMATLSGPSAVLGQHQRDGFNLALKQMGGRLGGLPTEVIIVDDELKPDVAVQKVQGLIERDKVDIVTGITFSNVMMAVSKPVFESTTILVGSNAGPSPLAGRGCSPFFFSTSWQNDQNHEAMGKFAQDTGYRKVVLITPNYQAGRDALAGFKRHFQGEVLDEIFTQLGQLDFAAEIARIASLKPDAVYTFMPGGMGVNLVRQYRQGGLAATPLLSAFTIDETTLPATQDAAVGFLSGAQWAPTLDTPANKAFVDAFEKEYGYVPSLYASQGFDSAMLIDAAIKAAGGKIKDDAAMQAGFKAAKFTSVRGDFRLNTNGFPVQDFYVTRAVKRADGKFQTEIVRKVFDNHADAYAKDCPLK